MPLLLRQLKLAGCIVTVDALNTQKNIAREIVQADAEYVLALKGNHPLLHQEVEAFLLDARERNFAGLPMTSSKKPTRVTGGWRFAATGSRRKSTG